MKLDRAMFLLAALTAWVAVAAHEVAADAWPQCALATAIVGWLAWRAWRGRPAVIGHRTALWVSGITFVFFMVRGISARGTGGAVFDVRLAEVGTFVAVYVILTLARHKGVGEYGWLYFSTLILMGTSGLLMPGVAYGVFFLAYLFSTACGLEVFHLWRAAAAAEATEEMPLGRSLLWRGAAVSLLGLPILAAAFILLPRRPESQPITAYLVSFAVQPVTGFSENVEMGAVGELQENPATVMRLNAFDADTSAPTDAHNLLLRGVALDTYTLEDGIWRWRQISRSSGDPFARGTMNLLDKAAARGIFPQMDQPGYRRVRLDVTLEPINTSVIFLPFMPESVQGGSGQTIVLGHWLQSLRIVGERGPVQYSCVSRLFPLAPARAGLPPVEADPELIATALELPPDLSERVTQLANSVAPDATYPDDYSKAMRLVEYLSGDPFRYTMRLDPTPGVEPVEDFLFNRREGHCEYFAASLAVMLRSVGIPCRMVNGFKVTERNPVGGHYVVRQADAHSWVEAYLQPMGWRTLDASVARPAESGKPFFSRIYLGNLTDAIEFAWVKYILSFNRDQQTSMRQAAQRGGSFAVSRLGRALDSLGGLLPGMPAGEARGRKLAGLLTLAALAAGTWGTFRLLKRHRGTVAARHALPAIRFYRRMEQLLARHGLRRSPEQTPQEFCESLSSAGWPAITPARLIVAGFYDARYGERELTDEELRRIEAALEEIKRARRGQA